MGKPGKWEKIVADLPRSYGAIDEDPSSGEKIQAVKKKILEPMSEEEAAKPELSSEAIEDLVMEINAMQAVVNDQLIRSVHGRQDPATVARLYRDVRKVRDMQKQQERTTSIIKAAFEQILVETYENADVKSLQLGDYIGGTVRFELAPHGSVIDKDSNRLWAIKEGLERDLGLGWQKVVALTKLALERGQEPPDGVKVTARVKVVYSK